MSFFTLEVGAWTQLTASPSEGESASYEVIRGMASPLVMRSMALLIAIQASLTDGW